MENLNVRPSRRTAFFVAAFLLLFLYGQYSIVYAKRGLDECFKTTEFGEKITVPCLAGYQPMSDAEVQKSIDQFRDFEQSDTKEKVHKEAKKNAIRLKQNPIPQHPAKRKITEQDLVKNKGLSYEERNQKFLDEGRAGSASIRASLKMDEEEAHIDPEIRRKMYYVKDGLYSVNIMFLNDSDFPEKYHNHEVFKKNTAAQYARDWREIIFTHYLGNEYGKYLPELGVVHELVSIDIYVTGSKDLDNVLRGKPVYSVHHIGTPFVPEKPGSEYGVPPVRIKQ